MEMPKPQLTSSILCAHGLCSDRVASAAFFQGLCPRGVVSNYETVTIPQLNEEGDVIEVTGHDWGSKTKVCGKLFAFHRFCVSVLEWL